MNHHLNPITTEEAILCLRLRNQFGPATIEPMANEDQPGYMPTVDVVRVVRERFTASYLRRIAKRYARRVTKRHGHTGQCPDALISGMALDIACREILDANQWMLVDPTARTR